MKACSINGEVALWGRLTPSHIKASSYEIDSNIKLLEELGVIIQIVKSMGREFTRFDISYEINRHYEIEYFQIYNHM